MKTFIVAREGKIYFIDGQFGRLMLMNDTVEIPLADPDGKKLQHICYTGELPWRNNARGKSCIPGDHTYHIRWTWSNRYKKIMLHITEPDGNEVQGRGGIRIHSGNFCGDKIQGLYSDVDGCIIVGSDLGYGVPDGYTRKQRQLISSGVARDKLEKLIGGKPKKIEGYWGEPVARLVILNG